MQQILKRIFDFIFALIFLVLLSPVFLVLAVLIKFDSDGPVFYKGERIGKKGKPFLMYKFRSMIVNADKKGAIHAAKGDPRITKMGAFLRTSKLDELPQLINIFKGDMSFVGPRPQVKFYTDLYNDEEKISLSVRPGMTDFATIYFINQEDMLDGKETDKSYQEKVEPLKNQLRIKYVKESSIFTDLKIIFMTVLEMFKKIIFK